MSAALIAQKYLADNFGKTVEEIDLRAALEHAARWGILEGAQVERDKVCLCDDFMTRDEFPHFDNVCPFYCYDCDYDTHTCHGCGGNLAHDDKEHNCT